eukprot:TRINITY_DN1379_c0_g1_i1.p1 TRINITY_DN1379_c0_g1~~TRINITY_DN1379_c0_g1_i1.p1  ORF type:complete len:126 (-),score=38.02 TRINITY_DN1379_c0_g1_i1:168-545(-)
MGGGESDMILKYKCENGHNIRRTVEDTYGTEAYTCILCGGHFPTKNGRYNCAECKLDYCTNCGEKRKKLAYCHADHELEQLNPAIAAYTGPLVCVSCNGTFPPGAANGYYCAECNYFVCMGCYHS